MAKQLFINNWAAPLQAELAPGATSTTIETAQAAELVGLGSGDYYLLTLAAVDVDGRETGWEIVKVTAVAGGTLTIVRAQDGTAAALWAAGTMVSARLTAGGMAALQAESGQAAWGSIGGNLADQSDLVTALGGKVDKQAGLGLSQESFTTTEKNKLGGIAPSATENDTDANLKNRANHTGTQVAATISDLQEAIGDFLGNGFLVQGANITLTYDDAGNTLTIAATGGGGGGMSNPMTAAGDLIIGGASGTPQRLAPGTNADVLTLVDGLPAWAASAEGGGSGPTKDTLFDYLMTTNPMAGHEQVRDYGPSVGGALRLFYINNASAAYMPTGGSLLVTGTGASNSLSNFTITHSTGTTATGNTRMNYFMPVPLNASAGRFSLTSTTKRLMLTCEAMFGALSTSGSTYKAYVSLGGTAADETFGNIGICLTYTHSENGGNWVIRYPNVDGITVSTINTSTAAQTTGGTAALAFIQIKAIRTSATESTITVRIGVETFTITDSIFNTDDAGQAIRLRCATRIQKSVGTTASTMAVRDPIIAFG